MRRPDKWRCFGRFRDFLDLLLAEFGPISTPPPPGPAGTAPMGLETLYPDTRVG